MDKKKKSGKKKTSSKPTRNSAKKRKVSSAKTPTAKKTSSARKSVKRTSKTPTAKKKNTSKSVKQNKASNNSFPKHDSSYEMGKTPEPIHINITPKQTKKQPAAAVRGGGRLQSIHYHIRFD